MAFPIATGTVCKISQVPLPTIQSARVQPVIEQGIRQNPPELIDSSSYEILHIAKGHASPPFTLDVLVAGLPAG